MDDEDGRKISFIKSIKKIKTNIIDKLKISFTMKKLISFSLMAVLLALSGFSQNNYTIPIGEGTSTTEYVPTHMNWKYSYTQSIYDNTDIGIAGDITSISYYKTTSGSYTRGMQIYLGQTSKSSFTGASDYLDISNFTLVFAGSVTFNSQQWTTITFTTPFTFDNDSNLVVVVRDTTGVYPGTNYFRCTTQSSNKAIYFYQDTPGAISVTNPTTATNKSYTSKLPNILLGISSTEEYCATPTNITFSDTTTSGITVYWSEVTSASTYTLEYKKASDTAWTEASSSISDTSYSLTDLDASITYDVRVKANCTENNSQYEEATFATACGITNVPYTENFDALSTSTIPNCWDTVRTNGAYPSVYNGGYVHSGSHALKFQSSTTKPSYAIMPQFADELNTLRVNFWTRPESESTSSGKFEIGYMTNPADTTTFVSMKTLQTGVDWNGTAEYKHILLSFDTVTADGPLYIAFRHLPNSSSWYWFIDDVIVETIPECAEPSNLAVVSTDTTTATLSWSSSSTTSTDFALYYKKNTDSVYTIAAATLDENNHFELTDLDPAITYNWTVGIICSDDTIMSFESGTFTTQCVALNVPYTENFDVLSTSTIPNCWDTVRTNGAYPSTSSDYYHSGTRSLKFQSSTTKPSYAIMPQFADELNTLRLNFWTRPESPTTSSGKFEIGYMTNPSDTTTFVSMKTLQTGVDWNNTAEYKHILLNFDTVTTDGPLYIAFRHLPNLDNWYWFIDDVTVETIPECAEPTGLANVAVADTFAKISWAASESVTYNLYYRDTTEATWTQVQGVTLDNDTTYTIDGLTQYATYQWYVAADCSTGEVNSLDTLQFKTIMTPISLPFTTDFSDESDTNFAFNNGTCTNKWYRGTPTGYTSNALFVSQDGTNPTYNVSSRSVVNVSKAFFMPANDSIVVEFDLAIGGESSCDYLKVLLTPSNVEYAASASSSYPSYAESSFSTNAAKFGSSYYANYYSLGITAGTQTHITAILRNPSPNGTANLYLVWKNDHSLGSNPPAVIQNLSVRALTCYTPEIVLSDTATTSVNYTISTGSHNEATSFEVQYKALSDTSWSTSATVDANGGQLTDLQPGTIYQIRVRAVCDADAGDVSAWRVIKFNTLCDNATLPFTENFDSYNGSTSNMTCWNIISNTTSYPYLSSSYANSGTRSMYFYPSSSYREYAVLPTFDAQTNPINTLRLQLYLRSSSSSSSTGIVVGAMSDRTDTTTFVAIDTIHPTATSTWQRHILSLSSYQGTAENIALKAIGNYPDLYMDDVSLEIAPNCEAISNRSSLHNTNVTENTVTLAFTDANSANTQWTIYYRPANDEEATWQSATVTQQDSTEITGLNSGTDYIAFVVPICSDGEESTDTSDYCMFSTISETITTFPYLQTFEDATTLNTIYVVNGNGPNQWHIGTATYAPASTADSNHSIYISKDNGVSNTYNSSTTSYSYAVIRASFGQAAEAELSFDYKVYGESNCDYLDVYLLDDSASLPVSSLPSSTYRLFRSTPATTWRQAEITLQGITNTTKQIVFAWRNDGSYGTQPPAAVDNISIVTHDCSKPRNLVVSNVLDDNVTLTWIDDAQAGSYTLYYKTSTDDAYTPMPVSDTTATLTLAYSTQYSVYVTTHCSEEDRVSDTLTFTTSGTAISDLPYVQDFEDATTYNTLSITHGTGTNQWYIGSAAYAPSSSTDSIHAIYISQDSGVNNTYNIGTTSISYFSIPVTFGSQAEYNLSFDYQVQGEINNNYIYDYLAVYVLEPTTQLSTTTLPSSTHRKFVSIPAAGWRHGSVVLDGVQNTTKLIVFVWRNDVSYGTQPPAAVDNIIISGSDCATPTSLRVDTLTGTSVTLSWHDAAQTGSYNVYYKLAADATYTQTTATDTTITLTLSASSNYTAYVTANCSGSESSQSNTVTFTTPCDNTTAIADFPYMETFTSDLGCWTNSIVTGSNPWEWESSDGGVAVFSWSTSSNISKLISPLFDITSLQNPYLTYSYSIYDYNGNIDTLRVYYRTDTTGAWTLLTTHSTIQNVYATSALALPNGSSTYQIAFEGINGYDANSVLLDDITIFDSNTGVTPPVVTAPTVTTLAASNIAQTTATLNGTVAAGSETITSRGFEWKQSTATTYTTVTATGNTMTYNLTSLTASTSYTYRAFAETASGRTYGSEVNFTTLAATPEPCTPTAETINASICDGQSYTLNGQTYATAGTYYDTLQNAAGCDSVITLNLTVNPTYNETVDTTITQGESVTLNGTTYTESGTYTATLTSVDGCDSTITLNLTVTDTATGALIDVEGGMVISLYPNPTSTNATLTIEGLTNTATIILTDQQGKEISRQTLQANAKQTTIDTYDLASGVYYVRIISGTTIKTQKLIKK